MSVLIFVTTPIRFTHWRANKAEGNSETALGFQFFPINFLGFLFVTATSTGSRSFDLTSSQHNCPPSRMKLNVRPPASKAVLIRRVDCLPCQRHSEADRN